MIGTRQPSAKFRYVCLLLAQEGDLPISFDLLVPLDESQHSDPALWRTKQEKCRVRHFPARRG